MATFPAITPKYGIRKTSAPINRTIRFADGFEQRILFGLASHQNPKVFSFTWEVSESDNFNSTGISSADTIENFLDARALDNASFDYQPPGEASSSKFVCAGWNKAIPFLNRATIQATFREVFES